MKSSLISVGRVVAVAILLASAAAAGCAAESPRSSGRPQIRVAAAADLNAALGEVITRFTPKHNVDVSVSYGSSGTFFAQLMNGAPFDLFLSADVEYPRRLAERGVAVKDSLFLYAVGRLVLWAPASSKVDVQLRGLQGLTDNAIRHIAIANPDHAPYGRAAMAALQNAGVLDAVRPRLVLGESVAQALQFVQSGAADAGLVAMSLALAPSVRENGRWLEIAADLYPPIEQGGAILSAAQHVDAVRAFQEFLISGEGRAILQQYGFALPDSAAR